MDRPPLPPVLIGALTASLLSTTVGFNPVLPAARAQAQGGITTPASGVLCDQAGPTCYDRQGPSIGLTQTYFGSIAANRLTTELRNRPPTNEFRLSNGAMCDLRAATCWSDGWQRRQLAPRLTQQLFGALPPSGSPSGSGLQGLETPQAGVVCDPRSQSCYDQAGLSLGLTREYFGAYAEQTALRNQAGQTSPRQFRLSNGSSCDVVARTCWNDSWNRQQVNVALSNQLFGSGGSGSNSSSQIRNGQCRLSRWFSTLFNGSCELRETRSNRGRLLEVLLQDGTQYSISRPRGGSYQISDRNGTSWPVQVRDQGRTLSFSWSDRVLTMTPQTAATSGTSWGQLLDILLGQ